MIRIGLASLLTLGLGACSSTAPFHAELPLAQGPAPQITDARPVGKLACVATHLTRGQRAIPFGVIGVADKTGKVNIAGNDSTGRFNTEGGADMATSSLARAGVRVIELSDEYRQKLDWMLAKASGQLVGTGVPQTSTTVIKGVTHRETIPNIPLQKGTGTYPVKYGIVGSIDGTDFIPGGGANVGVWGVGASYSQNRALVRIDLRIVKMPVGNDVGGEVVADTTVTKQMVNDDVELSLSHYFGPVSSPTLVNLGAGSMQREPWQYSTGAMLDLAVADLLEQVYHVTPCAHTNLAALSDGGTAGTTPARPDGTPHPSDRTATAVSLKDKELS